MSRLSHLGIGVALCFFCAICFIVGCFAFFGTAINKNSVPGASVFDGGFIVIYVVFGGLILGGLWFALASFRRVFRAAPRQAPAPAPVATQAPQLPSTATPDEKLAHLVRKPDDKPMV